MITPLKTKGHFQCNFTENTPYNPVPELLQHFNSTAQDARQR